MKKLILLFVTVLTFHTVTIGQIVESEKVDWLNLKSFTSKSITFKTNLLSFQCKECQYIEIKTLSGVSGYFILGASTFLIPSKQIEEKATAMFIRLSPKDSVNYLSIEQPKLTNDKGFISLSLLVLNDILKGPITQEWMP